MKAWNLLLYGLLQVLLGPLWLLRRLMSQHQYTYALLNLGAVQPLLVSIGKVRARACFLKAQRTCPAYAQFLVAEKYTQTGGWSVAGLPVMNKENYVKKYTLEERCYGGAIPLAGVVIDESSGSTGTPNNWVRSAKERSDLKRILQLNFQLIFADTGLVMLNCFALGPWATGMNVSMSMVDVGILKSIGPDKAKIDNTLELFGTKYHYLIFGYPPFLRSYVDSSRLDLKKYRLDFIVGGEGLSEGLRTHLLQFASTVISSYGASDLEINIGSETDLTIKLRRLCLERAELSKALFGRDTPPMLFQYNPLDYVIETPPGSELGRGELLYTIGRQSGAAPKIRYNLRDAGGVRSFAATQALLHGFGVELGTLSERYSRLPFLFVFGRNDATVPFYGAKIFPTDLERILTETPALAATMQSFQLKSQEDAALKMTLEIHLEEMPSPTGPVPSAEELHTLIFEGLMRVNQDFREVTRMFDRSQVQVFVHEFETGPFAGRDIRIKNRYIA